MLTAFDLFQATLFSTSTQCARRGHLEQVVSPIANKHEYSTIGLRRAFTEALTSWPQENERNSQEQVRHSLALKELKSTVQSLENDHSLRGRLINFSPTQSQLSQVLESVMHLYNQLSISIDDPAVFVVDELPAPYNTKGFSALTADEGDRKRHGIHPGVYFLANAVKPFLSEYFMAHELVHVWLGTISPDESCTIFEEGLAEYLSLFKYMARTYSQDVTANFYKLFRLNSAGQTAYESYVDGLKQVLFVLQYVSVTELLQTGTAGRPALDMLWNKVALDSADQKVREEWIDTTDVLWLSLAFPRSLVVSAGAYVLASVVENGMTVREAGHIANMSQGLVEQCLAELDERALITLRKDGQVVSRNLARRHVESGLLRYDFR